MVHRLRRMHLRMGGSGCGARAARPAADPGRQGQETGRVRTQRPIRAPVPVGYSPERAALADVLKSWDHLYTNSAAQPLGVSALAQLNLVMYTLEARFQRRVLGSINFGRTNDMESFFHLVDIISPMYSNMPLALDTHNLHVSKLMWNEGKEHRWAACGQVWGGVGRGGASICRQHAR